MPVKRTGKRTLKRVFEASLKRLIDETLKSIPSVGSPLSRKPVDAALGPIRTNKKPMRRYDERPGIGRPMRRSRSLISSQASFFMLGERNK